MTLPISSTIPTSALPRNHGADTLESRNRPTFTRDGTSNPAVDGGLSSWVRRVFHRQKTPRHQPALPQGQGLGNQNPIPAGRHAAPPSRNEVRRAVYTQVDFNQTRQARRDDIYTKVDFRKTREVRNAELPIVIRL